MTKLKMFKKSYLKRVVTYLGEEKDWSGMCDPEAIEDLHEALIVVASEIVEEDEE